jgi:hypothetical protein
MIASWLAYIYNLLLIAIRQQRVAQFINVLLSTAQTGKTELNAYIADARLRSAATWQVIWLEKLLTDALGYTVTIEEANGMPFDFQVSGVDYADATLARGLLNRYKMAGKSYAFNFADIDMSGQWIDPVCATTNVYDFSGQWIDPVCALELPPTISITVEVTWMGPSGGTDGFGGTISMKDSLNEVVDSHEFTNYSKHAVEVLEAENNENGYKLDFSFLTALLEGQGVVADLVWSEVIEMTDPSSSLTTGLYTSDQFIYLHIQPAS